MKNNLKYLIHFPSRLSVLVSNFLLFCLEYSPFRFLPPHSTWWGEYWSHRWAPCSWVQKQAPGWTSYLSHQWHLAGWSHLPHSASWPSSCFASCSFSDSSANPFLSLLMFRPWVPRLSPGASSLSFLPSLPWRPHPVFIYYLSTDDPPTSACSLSSSWVPHLCAWPSACSPSPLICLIGISTQHVQTWVPNLLYFTLPPIVFLISVKCNSILALLREKTWNHPRQFSVFYIWYSNRQQITLTLLFKVYSKILPPPLLLPCSKPPSPLLQTVTVASNWSLFLSLCPLQSMSFL